MASRQAPFTSTNVDGHNIDRNEAVSRFLTSKGLPANSAWLRNFVESVRASPPIGALQQSALFKVLSSDLTASIQSSASNNLPRDVSNPRVIELRLAGPIPVQILDIENIGSSVWSQIELLEAQERGETTRGREVIRSLPEERNEVVAGSDTRITSSGAHKLLLQDAQGTKMFALEQTKIDKIGLDMSIGSKLVLRDVIVARGLALLEPRNVDFLGGKIDNLDRTWKAERKQRLKQKIAATPD